MEKLGGQRGMRNENTSILNFKLKLTFKYILSDK